MTSSPMGRMMSVHDSPISCPSLVNLGRGNDMQLILSVPQLGGVHLHLVAAAQKADNENTVQK